MTVFRNIPASPRTIPVSSYAEMKAHIESGDVNRAGLYLAAWTCDTENEDFIQQDSKATLRYSEGWSGSLLQFLSLAIFIISNPAIHPTCRIL